MTHRCSWPGCTLRVDPHLWGCRVHWFRVPADLRRELQRHFVPGQSVSTWTIGYRAAFEAVERWITEQSERARP
jgi:hypothetical protein